MPERGWTRRKFLKTAAASGAAAVLPGCAGISRGSVARAPTGVFRIGFIVPRTGPLAEAGNAATRGAELGAAEAARLAELFGKRLDLVAAGAAGLDAGRREARRLIEQDRVFAIAGGLDDASCFALSELADRHGILFLNVGCSSDALRGERCRRTTFNVDASTAMYVDALAQWLIREAGLRRWYFVTPASDAGTAVYRRTRQALLQEGGEDLGNAMVPPGTTNHEVSLKKLRQARPDVAFLSLVGPSQAAFLQQYNELGPSFEVAGPFMDTVQFWAASPQRRAGIWPSLWHHKLFRYGAEQLNGRFRKRFDRPLEARGWASWMAVKILAEAVLRAGGAETSQLVRFLEKGGAQFDGHKGRPLTFRPWDHQLRQPLYLVRPKRQVQGDWDIFDSVAELPLGAPDSSRTSQDFLDQLGDPQTENRCRFVQP
ncbi:MAG: ABC transporter substrate-binding protein [Gemmatimonadetes bacterium]|nr:ABC transporter substrate-binding protein [Gemmatimonadota bacterium]